MYLHYEKHWTLRLLVVCDITDNWFWFSSRPTAVKLNHTVLSEERSFCSTATHVTYHRFCLAFPPPVCGPWFAAPTHTHRASSERVGYQWVKEKLLIFSVYNNFIKETRVVRSGKNKASFCTVFFTFCCFRFLFFPLDFVFLFSPPWFGSSWSHKWTKSLESI